MLNTVAGMSGLALQALLFAGVYLLSAPRRGRSLALLFAAIAAINGYSLVLLGAMTLGIPWPATNVILLAALTATLLSSRLRVRLRRDSIDIAPLLRHHWGAITIITIIVLIQVVAAAIAPELSIDGQLYHGPALAQMVQHGTLWGWGAPNQYIYYTDLTMVSGINLSTFTGAAVFDNGIQIPHLLILIFAINAALRVRFSSSWVRVALATAMVAAPAVWIQPRILYVDIAYAAALVALVAIMATSRSTRWLDLTIGAIAGASIVAMKPAGILTGAFLLIVFAVLTVLRMRRDGSPVLGAIGRIVAVFAPVAALASGFYLRNFVSFSNPVYPVKTKIGPIEFPGIIDLSVFTSGERGSGFIDPLRMVTYIKGIGTGVLNGVVKTDYDPRSGGFGHMPLVLVIIATVVIITQIVLVRRSRKRGAPLAAAGNWKAQILIAATSLFILLIQPSTFDARYVIGPTFLLLIALLLTTVAVVTPRLVQIVAGVLALAFALGQVVWTEATVFPGLADIREIRSLPATSQPITPGGVWGRGETIAWLPDDECYEISLQTSGGLSEEGMREASALSTLPYALYGADLCNEVTPIQIENYEVDGAPAQNPLATADYVLLFSDDLTRWKSLWPGMSKCWVMVQEIPSSEAYPVGVDVLHNECR